MQLENLPEKPKYMICCNKTIVKIQYLMTYIQEYIFAPEPFKVINEAIDYEPLEKKTSAPNISDYIVALNSTAMIPKRDNLPLEMPDRGWAAVGAACDVRAMRSPSRS